MNLLPSEAAAVEAYCAWLRRRFGERVRELAIFGSRARGDGNEDSDVDLLVVVDGLTGSEAREARAMSGDALTDHDVLLAPFVVSSAHMQLLRDRERTIAREIDRDAEPIQEARDR